MIGIRISVELILQLHSNRWSKEQILESYPTITENNLKAVFEYMY